MDKRINFFVGLDVHKDSISIGVAQAGVHEGPRYLGSVGNDLGQLLKALKRIGPLDTLGTVYEAGPCGYTLVRQLTEHGVLCAVISPSLIPRAPGDRVKTDRRDCLMLARLARAGELVAVWVPDAAHEAVRDLSRAREDAVEARLKARQQLKAMLLRHGRPYTGKTSWSAAHERYLAQVSFSEPAQQIAFEEYRQAVSRANERVERLTKALHEQVRGWRFAPVVDALMSLRGIELVSAATLVAEIGHIARFTHPRQLMGFLGLVPSEHSSGASRKRGSITKTGNGHARRILVEAAWNYRFPARVSTPLQRRQEGQPKTICDIAWKAQLRLCGRYRRLQLRGLNMNKTCVAIARELTGFVWDIARHVALSNS